MDVGEYNPVISARASWRKTLTFNATPALDFTGCEARSEVRNKKGGSTLYISVSETPSEDGYILIPFDGDPTKIHVYFSPTATARLQAARTAYWDIFIEYPNGEDVPKALEGQVEIDKSVTDPSYD